MLAIKANSIERVQRVTNKETATAFKEWAIVCEALGKGQQSIIFRKGGIHEGKRGFQFKHDQFFLFPTRFHEQEQNVKLGSLNENLLPSEYDLGEKVEIQFFCKIQSIKILDDWDIIKALEAFHIWNDSTIKERYEWSMSGEEEPFISLAILRVYKLGEVIEFPYEKKYGGCRSWLQIPEIREYDFELFEPFIADQEFDKLLLQINQIIDAN